jgi:hypothetical protein
MGAPAVLGHFRTPPSRPPSSSHQIDVPRTPHTPVPRGAPIGCEVLGCGGGLRERGAGPTNSGPMLAWWRRQPADPARGANTRESGLACGARAECPLFTATRRRSAIRWGRVSTSVVGGCPSTGSGHVSNARSRRPHDDRRRAPGSAGGSRETTPFRFTRTDERAGLERGGAWSEGLPERSNRYSLSDQILGWATWASFTVTPARGESISASSCS